MRRLLRKSGRVIVSLPFLYREHDPPNDYMRLTAFGAQELMARSGGTILRMKKVGNALYTLYTLFLERAIVNGELSELGMAGHVVNMFAIVALPILRPLLGAPPSERAGVYHHLLLEVTFP